MYRPVLFAKPAEFAAIRAIAEDGDHDFEPVLALPPRTWDYDNDIYKEDLEGHYGSLIPRMATEMVGQPFFLDISYVDSQDDIFGLHPIAWSLSTLHASGAEVAPLIRPSDSDDALRAAGQHAIQTGNPIGVWLNGDHWPSVDPGQMARVSTLTHIDEEDFVYFLDAGRDTGAMAEVALTREIRALASVLPNVDVTIAAASFPVTSGVQRGLTEHAREDLALFFAVAGRLDGLVHFSDTAIQRTDQIDLGVDPRFMSISASFRYTTADKWLLAKGELFRGAGGTGKGGAALVPALHLLVGHPDFRDVRNTAADNWVDDVLAGDTAPSNSGTWRKWGTLRHALVTMAQIA